MKSAIVLGATGLIGASLVEQLAKAAHISGVIAITRKPVNYASNKVSNAVVDFENLDQHSAIFKGDLLFSALGTTIKRAGSIDAQRKVDLNYQYQVAQLAACNGVSHYLLVSSSNANSDSRSQYLKMKGELEDQVSTLDFARVSVFQPSLLLGKRDHVRIGESIGAKLAPALCRLPGLRRYRPIHGHEVAAKMIAVSSKPGEARETFTLDEIFI